MKFSLLKHRNRTLELLERKFDELQERIVKELTEVVAYYKAFINRMPCEENTKLLQQLNKRVEELEYQNLNERVETLEKVCKIKRPSRVSRKKL